MKSQASLKTMVKAFKDGRQGVLLELDSMSVESDEKCPGVPLVITNVLRQYQEVFQWPDELPPFRVRDHAINL